MGKNLVTIPKKELIGEHKKLVKTLRKGSKKQLDKEADKQEKELRQYKRM